MREFVNGRMEELAQVFPPLLNYRVIQLSHYPIIKLSNYLTRSSESLTPTPTTELSLQYPHPLPNYSSAALYHRNDSEHTYSSDES